MKWTNSSSAVEKAQADAAQNPVGKHYEVKGYITGDNTTTAGYPVVAKVTVTAGTLTAPDPQPKAQPLPLNRVSIDGQNRLTHNRVGCAPVAAARTRPMLIGGERAKYE